MNYDDGKQPIVIRSSTGASKVLFQRDSCSISLPESKARVSELLTEASNARSWLDGILVAFIRSFLSVIQRISSWSVRQRGDVLQKRSGTKFSLSWVSQFTNMTSFSPPFNSNTKQHIPHPHQRVVELAASVAALATTSTTTRSCCPSKESVLL